MGTAVANRTLAASAYIPADIQAGRLNGACMKVGMACGRG